MENVKVTLKSPVKTDKNSRCICRRHFTGPMKVITNVIFNIKALILDYIRLIKAAEILKKSITELAWGLQMTFYFNN